MASQWTEVAGQLNAQAYIYSLKVHGGQIYGGTGGGGRLFVWNGVNAWEEVAAQLNAQTAIYSLGVYGGDLFGGTGETCRLFKWDGTSAWVQVAPQLRANDDRIQALLVYSVDGKLYGSNGNPTGTPNNGGRLYRWNDSNAWVEVAGPPYAYIQRINALVELGGYIFGGGGNNYAGVQGGALFRSSGGAWTQVAPGFGNNKNDDIRAMVVFNGEIYGVGGGSYGGVLLKWNGVNAWTQVAAQFGTHSALQSLIVYKGAIYAGSNKQGIAEAVLLKFNGSAWVQVAAGGGQQVIWSLVEMGGDLFGGTSPNGKLLKLLSLPNVTTQPVSDITATTATGNGTITAIGTGNCDHRGFVYDTGSHPDPGNVAPGASGYASFIDEAGSFGVGAFTGALAGLTTGKLYYIRPYAHNADGYTYGPEVFFLPSTVGNILLPNAAGDETGIRFDSSPGGGYPHPYGGTIPHFYLCSQIDTVYIPPGTYGFGSLSGNFAYEYNYFNDNFYRDLYALTNPSRRTEGIVKVKWKARVINNSYPFGEYKRAIKTHATVYEEAGSHAITPATGTVCEIFYTNLFTGAAWTVAECDDLQAGITIGKGGGYGVPAVDAVWVVVLWANALAVTDTPKRLSGATAELNGHVAEDESETCQVYFQWGETVAYGNTTAPQIKAKGDSFTDNIAGLNPGKSYHTRAVIVTACGETFYGADQIIPTLGGGGNLADVLVKGNFI